MNRRICLGCLVILVTITYATVLVFQRRRLMPPVHIRSKVHQWGTIVANETLHFVQKLSGRVFSNTSQEVTGEIASCVLHSFSGQVAKRLKDMFWFDPKDDNTIRPTTIGLIRIGDRLQVVIRIWLQEDTKAKRKRPYSYYDSYFYFQAFNNSLSPVTRGQILGIPAPYHSGTRIAGPEDPRIIKVGEKYYIVFSMVMRAIKDRQFVISIFLWDLEKSAIFQPTIKGFKMANQEKNWCPFTVNGTLHFVYSMDPLRILQCDEAMSCKFVHASKPGKLDSGREYLRGGTPFELYDWPYYIAMAHSKWTTKGKAELNAHFVVLRVDQWRLAYVSDVVKLHPNVIANISHPSWTTKTHIYPTGLLIENHDRVVVAFNIGDSDSYLVRFSGIRHILAEIFRRDSGTSVAAVGTNTIQKYVIETIKKEVGTNSQVKGKKPEKKTGQPHNVTKS